MEENNNQQPMAPQGNPASYQQTSPSGQQQTVYVNVDKKSNGMGTAGFVLALLAFIFCWVPILDFILWILGVIFSILGVFKMPRGLAIAGLVISFIGIIVLLVFFGSILAFA